MPATRRLASAAGLLLAMWAPVVHAATPPGGLPAPGRHAAQMCVGTTEAAPQCGSVQVELRGSGEARIRIDDIVYRLQLHSSQIDVVLMHGAMQIDEFTAPYEWAGRTLRFSDSDRNMRYEVRFTAVR